MPMLEKTRKQQIVTSTVMFSFGLAVTLFVAILISSSAQAGNIADNVTSTAGIGPLKMVEIRKVSMPTGGTQGSIRFLGGILYYAFSWLVLAGLSVLYRLKKTGAQRDAA